MKDDKLYLIHILECIERVESYVDHVNKDKFLNSNMIQDAVIHNLQTMAESTQRLSEAIKESHAQIDWYKIAGFRNVLVHDYLGIDVERIWNILQNELPELKTIILKMMK